MDYNCIDCGELLIVTRKPLYAEHDLFFIDKEHKCIKCGSPQTALANQVEHILELIGENINRDGLKETPHRVAKMFMEIFSGVNKDPKEVLKTFDHTEDNDLIIVRDIPLYSVCEHHLASIFGTVHIGYIPNGKIVGLSKFYRMVDIIARRPQVQERITQQIADTLQESLDPTGIIVTVQARHMCMESRGINKQGMETRTVATRGVLTSLDQQNRFFNMLGVR